MKGRAIATLAVVLLSGAAREARADAYQDHVSRAAVLTDHEQYQEALAELDAAYALRQAPALLFEMARVHERLGDARRALEGYERFLTAAELSADAPMRVDAEAAVSRLRPRYERKPSRGLTAGGAVLFGVGYLGAVVTGSLFLAGTGTGCASYIIGNQPPVDYSCPNGNQKIASGLLLIPGAGPLLAAFAYRGDAAWSLDWALVDGAAQAGGLLMMIYAAKHPGYVPVYGQAFQLVPFGGPRAGGLQAMGRF